MPKVSLGLPVYNGEKFIGEAIECIQNQTFSDFELIVTDNASTDSTPEIVHHFKKTDPRIIYHRNERNMGAAYNYNIAFEMAKSEYFKWASCDDKIAPDFLERCLKALERNEKAVLCYPRTVLIDENGTEIDRYNDNLFLSQLIPYERVSHLLRKVNLANPIFGLIRTENLRRTRLIGNFVASDYITLLELCLQGNFLELPEYLFYRRDHSTNIRKYSIEERAEWWDPINPDYSDNRIKLVQEMFKAVSLSNLNAGMKSMSYLQISHWIIRRLRAKAGKHKANIKRIILCREKP